MRKAILHSRSYVRSSTAPVSGMVRGALLCAAALFCPTSMRAQYVEQVLWSFDYSNSSAVGYNIEGGLISDSLGNLYGTTLSGGSTGNGVVFEVSPPSSGGTSWTETVLYSFCTDHPACTEKTESWGGLVFDTKGNLYGAEYEGGIHGSGCYYNGCGVIFELSPPSSGSGPWTEKDIYRFGGGSDGSLPMGPLVFDSKGNLYGVTAPPAGGLSGTVFELSPPAGGKGLWTKTELSVEGQPEGGLILDSKGNLYGAEQGANYIGDVFELSPPKGGSGPWTKTVLFLSYDGPEGGVVFDSEGNLNGATYYGGPGFCGDYSGCGQVYQLSPPINGSGSWTQKVLYTFCANGICSDGADPAGNLIFDSKGNLYGTTYYGNPKNGGVAFELSPPGSGSGPWKEKVLYSFCSAASCTDGDEPSAGLIADSEGNLYGPTKFIEENMGGYNGCIFELSPPNTIEAAAPVFSLAAGTYTSPQHVSISDTALGATIYYTLDGSTPTSRSARYKTALSIAKTTTVAAITVAPGYLNSPAATATYTIHLPQTITFPQPASPVTYGVKPITLSAKASSGLPVSFSVFSGPATLNGSTLTVTGTGTVVVAANQAGNADYLAAPQVTRSILVNQAAQTITFMQPASPVTYGVKPIALSAKTSSGLTVTFSVFSGPATVKGSALTVTGAGTVVVAANQVGNADYSAAPQVKRSIAVNKSKLTVTANNLSMKKGAAVPTLTYTMTGFVNKDTQANATTGQPLLSTTATLKSAAGKYPIKVTAGTLVATNYSFAFVNGTLTVTK